MMASPRAAPPEASGASDQDQSTTQKADRMYREQLVGAYRLLQETVGCVLAFDEITGRPGAAPLHAVLENPRLQQLQDADSARAAIELVTQLCCEEEGSGSGPATEDALRQREQDLQAREAELLAREAAIGSQEQRIQ